MTVDHIWCYDQVQKLIQNIHTVLKGHDNAVEHAVICFIAGGHLLIEDVPGVGKTTLAHALARSSGLSYRRLQFTSDILPSDILGVSVYDPKSADNAGQSDAKRTKTARLLPKRLPALRRRTPTQIRHPPRKHPILADRTRNEVPAPPYAG